MNKLPLMEDFYTLQGEGFYQGSAAYFVRLAGCDVGCHWCDVKDSWDAEKHPLTSVAEIVRRADDTMATIVVITGGEPLLYDLTGLTEELHKAGLQTNIETSGSSPLSGSWDWFCLSPKKFKLPVKEAYKAADELKVIIFNKSDFQFAEEQAAQVGEDCMLYLQPEWDKREEMMPLILEYILKNPEWQLSLQLHKYIGIE